MPRNKKVTSKTTAGIKRLRDEMGLPSQKSTYEKLEEGALVDIWGIPHTLVYRIPPVPQHVIRGGRAKLEYIDTPFVQEVEGKKYLVYKLTPRYAGNDRAARFARRACFEAFLKQEIAEALVPLAPAAERFFDTHIKHWTVRTMRSRWGSCRYEKGNISLATDLATHKSVYLKLIVFHEVAHTRIHNHGPAFKALMEKAIPAWQELQKALDEEGMRFSSPL